LELEKKIVRLIEAKVPMDVVALLDHVDEVCGRPEGVPHRDGIWLVDRWWRLRIEVDHEWRYGSNDQWSPAVRIYCCDRDGNFATPGFVPFEECCLTESQIARMYAFIERWKKRHLEILESKTNRHRRHNRALGHDSAGREKP
jgi:hypothetical protein